MTGLFGGTFNPPHLGHLFLAEESRYELGLEKVVFIPSGIPTHKNSELPAPSVRYKMTVLATLANPHFEVSDWETKKKAPSYTVETLRHFQKVCGNDIVFFMGLDSVRNIKSWKNYQEILDNFRICVWKRPGVRTEEIEPGIMERIFLMNTPEIPISSAGIRNKIKEKQPVRYLLPEKVYAYLSAMDLYK
ncbi:MAG: nicotinate-nucleotide adenylyltransferase [bacterium]